MQQTPRRHGAGSEIAGLKARYGALRQAAALPGADPATLLEAALAELDAAVAALAPDGGADEPGEGGQGSSAASHAERRLLHAVFQQAPVPLFLLGSDGTVRRVNAAAGDLLGSGPGYATGKAFTAFIDLPSRRGRRDPSRRRGPQGRDQAVPLRAAHRCRGGGPHARRAPGQHPGERGPSGGGGDQPRGCRTRPPHPAAGQASGPSPAPKSSRR